MNPIFKLLLVLFWLTHFSVSIAQEVNVIGVIQETNTNERLVGARVLLTSKADSTIRKGAISGIEGDFLIEQVTSGDYQLTISFIGFTETTSLITISPSTNDLGTIFLSKDVLLIDEMKVENKMIRVEQNGDTTAYNADAFKTNPDASVEELVTKMPGITIENGVVKSNGEEIKRVLIDGQEFFGEDASAALKNLPAEIVAKIQVYDRQSDQAQFTGIADGNETKALNIVTKPGKNNGQFGKIYAGYGTDNHYLAGGNVNFFKGVRKISVIGISNDVNQQNFSSEDILGISGTPNTGGGGRRGGNGAADNFLVGQQNGISQTHSIGINYSDKWGKKTKVTGSYFFNASKNMNDQTTQRAFILESNSGQIYDENYSSRAKNFNHRFNMRIEISLDSNNSLIYTPRLSYQQNNSSRITAATTQENIDSLINQLSNNNSSFNQGVNLNNDLLWRHKFLKPKRTFSIDIKTSYTQKDAENNQYSRSDFFRETGDSTSLIDQLADNFTNGYSLLSKFSYSEPLGEFGSAELFYTPSYSKNDADKRISQFDVFSNSYSVLDSSLSNVFENTTFSNQVGGNYRFRKEKVSFQLGGSYQNTTLLNDQEFPIDQTVQLEFNNFLPNAMFKYDFSKTKALRMFYRTSTRTPSIDQLQNVVDNSNPLSLSSGNPNLKQQFNHRVMIRFNSSNSKRASSFFFFLSGEYYADYITNSTFIAANDTLLNNSIFLSRGSQYRQPVNLQGGWNTRSFATYGIPVNWLKSNFNVNIGAGYTVNPGLINDIVNQSETTNLNSGITIASNISEKIDFTFSYTFNYNDVKNTVQSNSNNSYIIQNGSARINWMPWERLVINTNFNASAFDGLGSEFNQTILFWNAGIGYKILKQKQLELRVSVFDILNENNSIARNVTDSYIEDVQSQVLQRYFMFTATWNLRNFKSKTQD